MSWIVHLLAFTAVAQSFSERSVIKYIGQENGLSNNTVNSLYQDRYGFLWMGTYDGLNRYDGYDLSLIHISEPTRQAALSRMPSYA